MNIFLMRYYYIAQCSHALLPRIEYIYIHTHIEGLKIDIVFQKDINYGNDLHFVPPVCHLDKALQTLSCDNPSIRATVMSDLIFIDWHSSLLTNHISHMV